MKKLIPIILVLSIATNVFFLLRKLPRYQHDLDTYALFHYKTINPVEGLDFFKEQFSKKYPDIQTEQKHFIVYRWDSIWYDFVFRNQMKVLDSMAASAGNHNCEYVFVTEMDEQASQNFLKYNGDSFPHVKMLYKMDDYISSIYNIKGLQFAKPKVIAREGKSKKQHEPAHDDWKQSSFYLIMDERGKVKYNSGNIGMVLKDTAFFNCLKSLQPKQQLELLK